MQGLHKDTNVNASAVINAAQEKSAETLERINNQQSAFNKMQEKGYDFSQKATPWDVRKWLQATMKQVGQRYK